MKLKTMCVAALALLLTACGEKTNVLTDSGLDPEKFVYVDEATGEKTGLYVLKNANGMEVAITNFGARLVSIMVPDREGKMVDVLLGFDNIDDYRNVPSDFGATIGRYANRIKNGEMTIDSVKYQLPKNNGENCLHGGPTGWQYKIYEVTKQDANSITLTVKSADGDNNFPGNVTASVTYTLTDDNAIEIQYSATTDKTTVVNMTNHAYFNLNGDPSQPATDHVLYLNASTFTPVDTAFIPTGEIAQVSGTPMDFTKPKLISQDIEVEFEQLANGHGYDHNWCLDTKGDKEQLAASLYSPKTGIKLEVYTDECGVQFYGGNFLDGTVKGKNGIAYQRRASVCLETDHYPDSPNHPEWPTVLLKPGETYSQFCKYKFTVE